MSEGIVETYYSTIYCITLECPFCNVDFDGETKHIDRFTDMNDQQHHIVDCHSCGTRLDLVISHEYPMYLKVNVTPVIEKFL